jgi:hypothetical protein
MGKQLGGKMCKKITVHKKKEHRENKHLKLGNYIIEK